MLREALPPLPLSKGKGSDRTPGSRTQTPARDRTPSGRGPTATSASPQLAGPGGAGHASPAPARPQSAGGGEVVHTRTPEQFQEETQYLAPNEHCSPGPSRQGKEWDGGRA